jgi:hypothetical protein
VNPCPAGGGDSGPARMSVTEECSASGWVPLPPIVINQYNVFNDSLIAVGLKNAYLKEISKIDSLQNLANENLVEYCFTYVRTTTNDTAARWPRTDGRPDDVNPQFTVLPDTLIGMWHSHYDEGPTDIYKNQTFSFGDVFKIYSNIVRKNFPVTFSIITTRDYIYAVYITNFDVFKNYIRTLTGTVIYDNIATQLEKKADTAMRACTSCSFQQITEKGLLNITGNGNSNSSGIKIFKSPRQNIQFTLLTP